jgi:hypothetical protein
MWSQLLVNMKVGFSPATNPITASVLINRNNPISEFELNMVHVEPQFVAGINLHQQLKEPFFFEGGIAYTKKTLQYKVSYTMNQSDAQGKEIMMNESKSMIQLPVNIGVGIGKMDITSGVTALKTISSHNELSHIEGFSSEDNLIRFGWQMGVHYAFMHHASAGVEYQGILDRVTDGMKVNGQALNLMNIPSHFVFNMHYHF